MNAETAQFFDNPKRKHGFRLPLRVNIQPDHPKKVKQQLLKNQRPDSKMIERKNQTDNATERY
jgi:hypothetical protein